MLDLGVTPPDEFAESLAMARGTRAVLLTLVPNSSIQFVDFTMTEEAVARIRRRFFEDTAEGGEPSLHVALAGDGVFYHPVTNEPCDPARTYTMNGVDALAPFAGAWLPVPFMRVSRAGAEDEIVLDEGPSNWTRIYIAREAIAGAGAVYRVVLAVDTAIDGQVDAEQRLYPAPSIEDLKSGASFRYSDDVNDVAWFVSEAWVDDWIQGVHAAAVAKRAEQTGEKGALEHLAAYLTLLAVLKEACELPALRFMEPNAVGAYGEAVPVDLAVDLGSGRSAALLLEHYGKTGARVGEATSPVGRLTLRDLSRPWQTSSGVWSSMLTFSRATFGKEALSRWSGRTQAFRWPSPVRVGQEAERLAALPSAADAATGVSSPLHYVWDDQPRKQLWRFALDDEAGDERRNPVVSGSILAYLHESGDLLESRVTQAAATKPRFSRSSLVTLALSEILLHAIGAINAPEEREKRIQPKAPRKLDRVIITPPAGMIEAELAVLRRRIEDAVKLVWQAMGWSSEGHPLSPAAPAVVVVADAQTSTQVAWLENEIACKLCGRADNLLMLAGRPRAGFAGARSLRIATLDIGAATTGLAVVTWEPAAGGALAATRQLVDGFEIGCDDVVKAVAQRFILGAFAQRLTECRHPDPDKLIWALLGPNDRARPPWVGDLGMRLARELLAPAAEALIELYAGSEPDAGDAHAEIRISRLLETAGTDARSVADRLDIVAADDGADGFGPLDVMVPYMVRDLAAVVREILGPMIENVVRVLAVLDCDVVLLTGGGARLPVVAELIEAGLPLRPDRIIALHRHRFAAGFAIGERPDAKLLPALGALLQGRGAFGENGPDIFIRPNDTSRHGGFLGLLSGSGHLEEDRVVFELGVRSPHETKPTRTVAIGLPARVGARIPSLTGWPARSLWAIERHPESTGRAPKLPLKVTLELTLPERGKALGLKLASAVDGDGGRLDENEIVLKLKTRSFADGYWRDTGHVVESDTGGGQ